MDSHINRNINHAGSRHMTPSNCIFGSNYQATNMNSSKNLTNMILNKQTPNSMIKNSKILTPIAQSP